MFVDLEDDDRVNPEPPTINKSTMKTSKAKNHMAADLTDDDLPNPSHLPLPTSAKEIHLPSSTLQDPQGYKKECQS